MVFGQSHSSHSTHSLLKGLLIFMGALSILSTQIHSFFGLISPYQLFGLSTWGLKHGLIWQLISFAFLYPPEERLSIHLLLSVFFNLYLFYVVALSIIQLRGIKEFIQLFFGGILLTGITVSAILLTTAIPALYCAPSTISFLLLTAWMMIDPERQILLFMTIPIRIKWLVLIFLGGQIFIAFANGYLIQFTGYLIPCLYGWLYALFSWELLSPFRFTKRLENALLTMKHRLKNRFKITSGEYIQAEPVSKIYPFHSSKTSREDIFIDACLSKVSKKGTKSLTFYQRMRLKLYAWKNRSKN